MIKLLKRLIAVGTHPGMELSEIKRIKLLNQVALVFMLGVGIKLVMEIVVQDPTGVLVAGTLVCFFGLSLLLNYLGKLFWARAYFCFICIVAFSILNLMYGQGFGAEFAYFPFIMMIIISFDDNRTRIGWMLFLFACYISSSYYLTHFEPLLIENFSSSSFYFNFFVCAIGVFMMSLIFISENKLFEKQSQTLTDTLKSQNQDLTSANIELERFAFIASHDLKEPLRNIIGFSSLTSQFLDKQEYTKAQEFLEVVHSNANRMNDLIVDTLELIAYDRNTASFSKVNLNEVLSQVEDLLADTIEQKQVEIQKPPNFPAILARKNELLSCFKNLIENGIKYNQKKPPIIQLNYYWEEGSLTLTITDNGNGISEIYYDKIFDMYERLVRKDEYQGTGLGLAICKKIMDNLGGSIWVSSEVGIGSTFYLSIPRHRIAD